MKRGAASILGLCLLAVAGLLACDAINGGLWEGTERRRILDTDLPSMDAFEDAETVRDFEIEATLRLLRDPDQPQAGMAAVIIDVTAHTGKTHRNIHGTVWLPEGTHRLTPLNVIGTNLEEWHETLTPAQPSFGMLTRIRFDDFERRSEILDAFRGPTLIKIRWNGGERLIRLPESHWRIEVVEALPVLPAGDESRKEAQPPQRLRFPYACMVYFRTIGVAVPSGL